MPPTNFIDGLMTPHTQHQPTPRIPRWGGGMPAAFDHTMPGSNYGGPPRSPAPAPTPAPMPGMGAGHGATPPTMPPSTSQGPPPGFTAQQWAQLLTLSKKNPSIAAIMKQYSTAANTPDPAWRRQQPTDNTQLARQLSYNAGELGMPGSRTGALQLPAFGSNAQAVNNPDMSTYGQAPGLGEATFYTQSMKGGMAPIAAMAPFGVPEGWNPGGTQTDALKKQLMEAFTGSSGGGGAPVHDKAWAKQYMKNQARSMGMGAGPNAMGSFEAMQLLAGGGGPDFAHGGAGPDMHTTSGSNQKPTPMQFPYGF